jgi:hypothetical protein
MKTSGRLLGVVFICTLGLTLAACSGTVKGKVTDKSSGKPVQGAVVQVGTKTATTAADGTYVIQGVPTGSYGAKATHQGYADAAGQVQVKRGTNSLDLVLEDGSLRVKLQENAVVREPIKNAVVTLDGSKMKASASQLFVMEDVLLGDHKLVVHAPNHEAFKATVSIQAGPNTEKAALSLTPEETYMRYYDAYRFGRYQQAYLFLHPVVRKHYPYAKYAADERSGGETLGLQLFGTHYLAKWRAAYANKTFKHVAAIDRALRIQTAFGNYTDNRTQHWQSIKGRWYIIFDWH